MEGIPIQHRVRCSEPTIYGNKQYSIVYGVVNLMDERSSEISHLIN